MIYPGGRSTNTAEHLKIFVQKLKESPMSPRFFNEIISHSSSCLIPKPLHSDSYLQTQSHINRATILINRNRRFDKETHPIQKKKKKRFYPLFLFFFNFKFPEKLIVSDCSVREKHNAENGTGMVLRRKQRRRRRLAEASVFSFSRLELLRRLPI